MNLTVKNVSKKLARNISGGNLYPPVDCSNPYQMIQEGIHPPQLKIDRTVFVKTPAEKKKLADMKKTCGMIARKSLFLNRRIQPKDRLIIHLVNVDKKKDFKNTFNYECKEHEVRDILSALHDKDKIKSVKFNGKEI